MHRVLETSEPGNDRDRNGNGKKVALMASPAQSPHRATTTTTRMSSLAATARRRKCERMESTTRRRCSARQNHATQHDCMRRREGRPRRVGKRYPNHHNKSNFEHKIMIIFALVLFGEVFFLLLLATPASTCLQHLFSPPRTKTLANLCNIRHCCRIVQLHYNTYHEAQHIFHRQRRKLIWHLIRQWK